MMSEISLNQRLARARIHRMDAQERRDQEISFIAGNETLGGQSLHRGTVTMAMPPKSQVVFATASSAAGWEASTIPFDVNGPVRQFCLVQELIELHAAGEPVVISPELIQALHKAAGDGSSAAFGVYRDVAVTILGSQHRPLAPLAIPDAVTALCDHLKARWDEEDAIALSAYALWGLNWIHPFLDGNGRTSRALCYLILNLRLGMQIPGSPTLIEQMAERRDQYYDALIAADLTFDASGRADLAPLENFLEELLIRQLRSQPALSSRDEEHLAEIVARRIEQLNPDIRETLFGSAEIAHRAWSIADYLIVHVGSGGALDEAEALFERAQQPFPRLLAARGEPALLTLMARERGAIVRPRSFEVVTGAALWLEPNAAIVLERPKLSTWKHTQPAIDWELDGALYILRRGEEITDLWALDVLEMLVSRHIQEAQKR